MTAKIVTIKTLDKVIEYQIEDGGQVISHGHQSAYTTETTLAELDAIATADAITNGLLPAE